MFPKLMMICWIGFALIAFQDQTSSEKNAIAAVQALKEKIEGCAATEQVAPFQGKWVKVSWGPPQNVKFDVEKTTSLPAPYKGVITFSIPYSNGLLHEAQQDAQQDKDLRVLFVSPAQYTLQVFADSTTKLESMQIRNSPEDKWGPYNPAHPERFCWITVAK